MSAESDGRCYNGELLNQRVSTLEDKVSSIEESLTKLSECLTVLTTLQKEESKKRDQERKEESQKRDQERAFVNSILSGLLVSVVSAVLIYLMGFAH